MGVAVQAHRYLVEQLGGEHALTMVVTRYIKFLQSILKSPKLAVQMMIQKVWKNVETVTGRNIRFILDRIGHGCDIFSINPNWVKKKVKFCEISEENKWRVNLIKEIVDINQKVLDIKNNGEDEFLSKEQLNDIINFVSTS